MKKLLASVMMLGATAAHAESLDVALLLDKGGKDDKSFNAAAYAGCKQAEKELKAKCKVVEAPDDNAFEQILTNFAKANKYKVIIGVGFAQGEAVNKVAQKFPKSNFAIVDFKVDQPNVRSLLFAEHEGSFVVGAIAALTSKTGKVGFIGGMEVPIIRRFQMAYEAGAKHVKPDVVVETNYVGSTADAWKDPTKAKELSFTQFGKGVDVIFAAAGMSGLGVIDAAKEKNKLAIGVDSNQNCVKKGFVLTSMLKRVDVAVFDTIKLAKENKFQGGAVEFSLKNNGIDFAMDECNKGLVSAEVLKKANEIKADIIAGKIVPPDYYKKQ